MIIHSEPFFDNTRIEIVNGEDIALSYKNNSKVSSCMSNDGRWKRQEFWQHVPQCNLIRVMNKDDVLLLRAFLWEAVDNETNETVKYLDRIYYKSYPYDFCSYDLQIPSHPKITEKFANVWNKFADVRSSNRRLHVTVEKPDWSNQWPMTDTFKYLSVSKTTLSNWPPNDRYYRLGDHRNGTLC